MNSDSQDFHISQPINSASYGYTGSSDVAEVPSKKRRNSSVDETTKLLDNSADETVDLHDLSNPGQPTTNMQTLMNLVKCNIGIGVLAMPSVMANAGLVMGTGGIILLGFLATYCMKQLVNVSAYLVKQNPNLGMLNYPDTCAEAVAVGHPFMRRFARKLRILVNVFIVTAQMMCCISYILFIAGTVEQVVSLFSPVRMPIQLWELLVLIALVPYIQVRNLKLLSIFTTIANVCLLVALLILFRFVIIGRTVPIEYMNMWGDISCYPLAFGTIIFAFEGINLVMPLRNKMKHPKDFGGWDGVLILGMTVIAVTYVFMGFYGYIRIGDSFSGVLTNYVIPLIITDPLGWWYLLCVVFVIVQVFLTYGLQLYVPVIILFPPIAGYFELSKRYVFWAETLFRCLLAIVTFAFAATIPCLGEIFSLVGAFTGSSLSILFPALIDLVTFFPVHQRNKNKLSLVIFVLKNALILLVGFMGFFIGTYTSIQQIVAKMANGQCAQ